MTPDQRIADLEALLREWRDKPRLRTCECGQWLGTHTRQPDRGTPCLHCRTRVALAGEAT